MALKCGYFNSIEKDRLYSADDFASFYDGLIIDGVYSSVGNKFYVTANGGMGIKVETGRAWFDHTWTWNTSPLELTIPTADTVYNRIDAAVIEVNKNDRQNYIKIVKGIPANSPARPSLTKTSKIKQYALAYITVARNATSISNGNIVNVVGNVETPIVSFLNVTGLPPMHYGTADITAGVTPLYTGQLYLVYE